MGRAERITREIKFHDPMLYCERDGEGKLCVFRKSTRWESYAFNDGSSLRVARPTPHFIFALTHDWKKASHVVDWGIEPIMARLRAIDLWQRDLAEEIIQDEEKAIKSRERDARNSMESFLYDFRSQFKRTFADVNVANLSKKPETLATRKEKKLCL